MKHHAIAAAILLGWSLSWWTGSSRGFWYNHYKTEAACKAAAQEINSERRAKVAKLAQEAAAEERANPNIGHGVAGDLGPVNWECIEAKVQPAS
jgi:hypothetical protein